MIYLWPKNSSPPAFFPTRAFADEAEAARWRGFARARIAGSYARGRGGRRLIGETIGVRRASTCLDRAAEKARPAQDAAAR